jgi:hypothetical protein
MQKQENPAGGPGFKDYRGDGSFPQSNLEAFSHKCQQNYDRVHLLADLLDRHLALRKEVALLRAENARLKLIIRGCA